MSNHKCKQGGATLKLLILALIFLTNPIVTIFDYLPDAVAYIIIFSAIKPLVQRAPYFDEANDKVKKLIYVSLAKIPAYFVMVYAKGQNTADNDIYALFTFVFTVLEVVLLFEFIKNIFSAFFYLGERSGCDELISSFVISKKGKRMSPDSLRLLSYIFIGYKSAVTALPEMLLLTRGVDTDSYAVTFNPARLYPYVIIISVVSVFAFGIIMYRRWTKYLKAFLANISLIDAANSLHTDEALEEIEQKEATKKIKSLMDLFIISSVLIINISFDNLLQINLLPGFLYGIFIIFLCSKLNKYNIETKNVQTVSVIWCIISLITYIVQINFLTEYGYGALALSDEAKMAYIPVMITSFAELIATGLTFLALGKAVIEFVKSYVGIQANDKRYSRIDADYHKAFAVRIKGWYTLAFSCSLCTFVEIIFRYFAKEMFVSAEDGIGVISEGIFPWFGVITTLISIFYILYTTHLFTSLKEGINQNTHFTLNNVKGQFTMSKTKCGKILSIATAISTVILGVTFIVCTAHLFFTGGSTPYSQERVGEYLAWILIPALPTILLVIAGLVYNAITNEKDCQPTGRTKGELLESFNLRFDFYSFDGKTKETVEKIRADRNKIDLISSFITSFSLVFVLDYIFFIADFTLEDMNGDIVRALAVCLPIAIFGLVVQIIRAYMSEKSCEKELEILRGASRNGDVKKIEKKETGENKINAIFITRAAVGAVALILVVLGIFNGGMDDVLAKAVKICTECIGLG